MADIILKSEPAYLGDLIGDALALCRLEAHLRQVAIPQDPQSERALAPLRQQRQAFLRRIVVALVHAGQLDDDFEEMFGNMVPVAEQAAVRRLIFFYQKQLEHLFAQPA